MTAWRRYGSGNYPVHQQRDFLASGVIGDLAKMGLSTIAAKPQVAAKLGCYVKGRFGLDFELLSQG
jgi:hypothetical protein